MYFFGDEKSRLSNFGNVRDRQFLAAYGGKFSASEDWDDGHALVAPVGVFPSTRSAFMMFTET